jgi:acyl carrier protein
MDERDIRNKIKAAIAKISDIEATDIADTASFKDDLGLDSLVLLEISVEIEIQFGLEVHEEDLKQLQTVPWSGTFEVERHATEHCHYWPGVGDVYWHWT